MEENDSAQDMTDRDKLAALYDVLARNVIDISHLSSCVTRLTDVVGMLADTVHELYTVVNNLYAEPIEGASEGIRE